jgi:hypothetical protein
MHDLPTLPLRPLNAIAHALMQAPIGAQLAVLRQRLLADERVLAAKIDQLAKAFVGVEISARIAGPVCLLACLS